MAAISDIENMESTMKRTSISNAKFPSLEETSYYLPMYLLRFHEFDEKVRDIMFYNFVCIGGFTVNNVYFLMYRENVEDCLLVLHLGIDQDSTNEMAKKILDTLYPSTFEDKDALIEKYDESPKVNEMYQSYLTALKTLYDCDEHGLLLDGDFYIPKFHGGQHMDGLFKCSFNPSDNTMKISEYFCGIVDEEGNGNPYENGYCSTAEQTNWARDLRFILLGNELEGCQDTGNIKRIIKYHFRKEYTAEYLVTVRPHKNVKNAGFNYQR